MTDTSPPLLSLGIDIGGTSVKAVLMCAGEELASARSEPYQHADSRTLCHAITAAAQRALVGQRPDAIGLCLPGLWDSATRTVTYSANVPGIMGLALADMLSALPVDPSACRVVSDAFAAASDVRLDPLTGAPLAGRLLAISLGTGVGACVLEDDGTPLRVSGDSSGHIGQFDVTLDPDDAPTGSDGSAGSLEAYIGLHALRDRYRVPDEAICAAISPGDPPLRALARAIRISHAIYRPHHIRLLGGVGIRLSHLLAPLRANIDARLTSLARPGWTLGCGTSDLHAARGAARIAAQSSQTV